MSEEEWNENIEKINRAIKQGQKITLDTFIGKLEIDGVNRDGWAFADVVGE